MKFFQPMTSWLCLLYTSPSPRDRQHTGFCGTRLQVSYYQGLQGKQAWFPNCGRKEKAAHLCLCPSEDRTRLLIESTKELQDWLQDDKTERELAYWLPKYILMRGTKNMAEMGHMSPQMRCPAKSQDVIGWKNFMEGRISRWFYHIQNEHLTLGDYNMDALQWTRQLISKVLHITHSQWIFRNFTLHDKQKGWLRRKELHEIMTKIDQLGQTNVNEIPESSRFLLEMDYDNLMKSNIHNKTYWVVAMEAKRPTRERLNVIEVEEEIKSDSRACKVIRGGGVVGPSRSNTVIPTLSKRKSLSSTFGVTTRTNKRFKPGD